MVRALARSSESAAKLEAMGAVPVAGEAARPAPWSAQLRDADIVVDLAEPPLPTRLTLRATGRIVAERIAAANALAGALAAIPEGERPVWFSISGADDLEPDANRTISHESATRTEPTGFARIGLPVRRAIERSGVEVAYVYFGVMVYGPGKGFAEHVVDALRRRRARIIGPGANRLPIVHVTDAARAVVHLAGLPREQVAGRTFLVADGADTTQRELFVQTARLMGVKPPGSAPVWLASLVAGRVAAEAMTADAHVDNSALRDTGFEFRHPSMAEGVPQTLVDLGVPIARLPTIVSDGG